MLAGELDWPKVRLCADAVRDLHPDVQRRVLLAVLDYARTHTTGQLRAKLARLVIQADPDAARKRYRRGVAGRRVELGREDDGTPAWAAELAERPCRAGQTARS
jgi:hypothetical protein